MAGRSRRSSARDWRGNPRGHAKASHKGWKRHSKARWAPKPPSPWAAPSWQRKSKRSKKRRGFHSRRGGAMFRLSASKGGYTFKKVGSSGARRTKTHHAKKHAKKRSSSRSRRARWTPGGAMLSSSKSKKRARLARHRAQRHARWTKSRRHKDSWMRDPGGRDWPGQPRRHASASRKGWKRTAKKGWAPKWRRSSKRR